MATASVVVVATALGACSGSDDEAGESSSPPREVIRGTGDGIAVRPVVAPDVPVAVGEPVDGEFDSGSVSLAGFDVPDGAEVLPTRDGRAVVVGPQRITDLFDGVEVITTPDDGVALLIDGAESRAVLGEIAQACFDLDDSCPSGRLAVEFEGEVLDTGTVSDPSLVDRILVLGIDGAEEARALADELAPSTRTGVTDGAAVAGTTSVGSTPNDTTPPPDTAGG